MNRFQMLTLTAAVALTASTAFADGRTPGSVLVYPVHRSGFSMTEQQGPFFTVVNVTNSNLIPQTPVSFGGSTLVHFEYLNVVPNTANPFQPLDCDVFNRVEFLTPADTLSVLTRCHNAFGGGGQEGYLVVSAQNPALFDTAWSFNFLMGSEFVINASGAAYSINAIPFDAIPAQGNPTDLDGDGFLDFNGIEYEGVPELLYIDSFVGLGNSQLALLNLTNARDALVTVQFDVWNDNEFPLSTTRVFSCWFDQPLVNVSTLFDGFFLANNTPDDDSELDVNCDGVNDFETGWARINGVVANSPFQPAIPNPALLGSITAGPGTALNGGRLLWESNAKQNNGQFFDS